MERLQQVTEALLTIQARGTATNVRLRTDGGPLAMAGQFARLEPWPWHIDRSGLHTLCGSFGRGRLTSRAWRRLATGLPLQCWRDARHLRSGRQHDEATECDRNHIPSGGTALRRAPHRIGASSVSNTSSRKHATSDLRRLEKRGMAVEYAIIALLIGLAAFQVVFAIGTKAM